MVAFYEIPGIVHLPRAISLMMRYLNDLVACYLACIGQKDRLMPQLPHVYMALMYPVSGNNR